MLADDDHFHYIDFDHRLLYTILTFLMTMAEITKRNGELVVQVP